ncbi:dihydropyrimidine dehydrogenase [Kosmotoga arenicorallina S304]|uniref:Dihydropyrimidine dehydrogenase n=1 Tax=Kosmotoga arenicorallina S304 TaxID=1453497 RepID=A0A176K0P2_9BACT|nr:dihydropyrimidine dehydrogenase [Kosmotoga arenicorallina S304]
MKERIPMPEQSPEERIRNFSEVALGYTLEMAIAEADRCLQCPTSPCISGCPVEIDIPGFIKAIRDKNFRKGIEILKDTNNLPAICGRVCPQEKQCEAQCVLGKMKGSEPVAIGRLERFLADLELSDESVNAEIKSEKKGNIAIIGAGPAGLTAAADLAKMGYSVTIYEAFNKAGGVLIYGIPEFRLPKTVVEKEIEYIRKLGVKFEYGQVIGRTIPFEKIRKEFDAIFIGIGAGAPRFMGIPGSNLNNIYSASEFLTRVNLLKANKFPEFDTPVNIAKRVAVIGAGNVSMDAARTARRLGAEEVMIIYRRSELEMPARLEEYHHAVQEGIIFHWLTQPVEYMGDINNNVRKIRCIKMELGAPDESGRRRPVPIEGSEFTVDVELVIEAIGQKANAVLKTGFPGIKLNKWGYIEADPETGKTSLEGVFAGGDIVTGSATVIEAMGAGKRSARAINNYVSSLKRI